MASSITMSPSNVLKRSILATFLQVSKEEVQVEEYKSYFEYYQKQCRKSGSGLHTRDKLKAHVQDNARFGYVLDITHELVLAVVELIWKRQQRNEPCYRVELQSSLASDEMFAQHSKETVNQAIDLALRLWLALNIRQEGEFSPGGAKSVQWDSNLPLHEFISHQFPEPRMIIGIGGKDDLTFPRNFTAMNLRRYSGIKVKWTSSLSEHLILDREHRMLKIFPLKRYLQGLKKRSDQ
jgi:hypothetical protein